MNKRSNATIQRKNSMGNHYDTFDSADCRPGPETTEYFFMGCMGVSANPKASIKVLQLRRYLGQPPVLCFSYKPRTPLVGKPLSQSCISITEGK